MSPADVVAVSEMFGRAFEDDPITEHLFGGHRDQLAAVTRLYRLFCGAHIDSGESLVGDGVAGAALWAPPGTWRLGWTTQVRLAPQLLRLLGWRSIKLLSDYTKIEHFHSTLPPDHWYLSVLGTDPIHQGRGVGAAVMEPILERCDLNGQGAYLESSKESNVPYYRRFGFEVISTFGFTDGPEIYQMWRDPQPV